MGQGRSTRNASRYGRMIDINQDFRCIHCGYMVPATYIVAGVRNRNHCPYCLWSRHLDWREAGDRLSACRAPMQPVGLTTKQSRNKYANERDGELMLVHECSECGVLDINRIAADDDAIKLMAVFEESAEWVMLHREALHKSNVTLLRDEDIDLVQRRLGIVEETVY
ncbi:MAG: hypothetical protein AVDCRST_MAG93-8261 [uncultured Chloroflexia bacterium]|uniref:RNHCP domain-containing protein n=1 Tax=uncultured Chloroflexia bacterium TaxID=1672391 RepID=A0A6J4MXC7_9CHLR|nr:MAG: hypothetical protein AVDCRST_MAG93-8261 [uncultured Chloroflexia bacterium]